VLEKNLGMSNKGLQAILEEISRVDPRAKKIKTEEFGDRPLSGTK